MTGLQLIAQERKEQIYKHGFTKASDRRYTKGELVQAAIFCLALVGQDQRFVTKKSERWPEGWSPAVEDKIRMKSDLDKLITAGALYQAECDRLKKPHYYATEINQIADRINHLKTQIVMSRFRKGKKAFKRYGMGLMPWGPRDDNWPISPKRHALALRYEEFRRRKKCLKVWMKTAALTAMVSAAGQLELMMIRSTVGMPLAERALKCTQCVMNTANAIEEIMKQAQIEENLII